MKRLEDSKKTNLELMVDILGVMHRHRKASPTIKSDEVYYALMGNYYKSIINAKEEGKFIGAHTVMAPIELFHAMDIVPLHLESTAAMMTIMLNKYGEYLGTASEAGLAPEVCSAHRILAASSIKEEMPRPDFIVWTNQVCDNTAKSGDLLMDKFRCPGFFLERPYRGNGVEFSYFVRELERLIHFLEEQTGRKMDYDRLREVVALSWRTVQLYREIYQLRKAIPAPMKNRTFVNMLIAGWLCLATPEGVAYLELIRDEIREKVENKQGAIPQERFRLISCFIPPFYELKLLDWLEREYGASIVMESGNAWVGQDNIDLSKPLESLAMINLHFSTIKQMHGPADSFIRDTLRIAREFKPHGALYFAHIGCRQACALIRSIKDALQEECNIPTLVLDCDVMDPSFASTDDLKDKLEGFFEMLTERV